MTTLLEQFEGLSSQIPLAPDPIEEAEFLSHYGTVAYELVRRQQRSTELRQEWQDLAVTHTPLHFAGMRHLQHLHEQSFEIRQEIERLRQHTETDIKRVSGIRYRVQRGLKTLGLGRLRRNHE